MRAAYYDRTGAARDVLVVGTLEDADPAPGEVRVRVAASGVNPSDCKARAGSRPMVAPRVVPQSDGAGVIDAVGAGVPAARLGERVWLWNGQWKRALGTAAEAIVLPAAQAVPLPEAVPFEAGACLGIPALTAHRALTTDGGCAGKIVLVTGGAGAVGHYAIQMARLLGADRVIATVSSPEKAAHATAAGADATIDYRREDVPARVRVLTDGRGADRIVEVDAAANAVTIPAVIAREGLCVVYGSGAATVPVPFGPMIGVGAALRFFIVYELPDAARAAGVADITDWLEHGRLTHPIGATFPLALIAEAHEAVEQQRVIGNVVVTPG